MVCTGIGPLIDGRFDEAFGFSIGAWRVRFGSDVLQSELLANSFEGVGLVARPVVGHDAPDRDVKTLIVGKRRMQEDNGALLFLIFEDVCEGDAGVVINRHMEILPAITSLLSGTRV